MSGERPHDMSLADVARFQRDACAEAGSQLYATLLDAMADDIESGGTCAELLAPHADGALHNAIPLRLMAGVHRLVLAGDGGELAAFFPSVGGHADGDPVPAFLALVSARRRTLERRLHHGVQTNEIGRAAALVGAFHHIAATTGLPLRTLEVGASSGLLSRWDRLYYRSGDTAWGDLSSPVAFTDVWGETPPAFHGPTRVAERSACDIAPIDVTTDAGVEKLRSFLWPDQLERRERLDAAIEVARAVPMTVETADAGSWVHGQLRASRPGMATVVFHSIVLQYLPRASFVKLRSSIREAGARATSDAPVCWLRMEPAGAQAEIRLTSYPGPGTDQVLGTTGYHGPPVHWRA